MDMIIVYQSLAALFCIILVFTVGYYVAHRKDSRTFEAKNAHDREEMLTIERALKQFWDHEREALQTEKQALEQKVEFLQDKLEQYRRKAAGIGVLGLRKTKVTDMLISLLIENETLEEKLFLQNLKLKEERDEYLRNEMRNISYKRILLSELINHSEVRREMERAINDRGTWKRLQVKAKDMTPLIPEKVEEDDEETA